MPGRLRLAEWLNALGAISRIFWPELMPVDFWLRPPLAARLGLGFTMIRKKGKLPGPTISHEYDLEYGTDIVEIQEDAVEPGQRVVILDDLLATGGTLGASINLINKVGGNVVGGACLIELTFLNGRDKLNGLPFDALMAYDD